MLASMGLLVQKRCEELQRLSDLNLFLDYERFLIGFLSSMSSFDRKAWSYHGVLPIREPTDFSSAPFRETFDLGNPVYQIVIHREVPHIRELMEWSNLPNACTCGDCIESLLAFAADPDLREVSFAGITVHSAEHFFKEMSYNVWRIARVLHWHNVTAIDRNKPFVHFSNLP